MTGRVPAISRVDDRHARARARAQLQVEARGGACGHLLRCAEARREPRRARDDPNGAVGEAAERRCAVRAGDRDVARAERSPLDVDAHRGRAPNRRATRCCDLHRRAGRRSGAELDRVRRGAVLHLDAFDAGRAEARGAEAAARPQAVGAVGEAREREAALVVGQARAQRVVALAVAVVVQADEGSREGDAARFVDGAAREPAARQRHRRGVCVGARREPQLLRCADRRHGQARARLHPVAPGLHATERRSPALEDRDPHGAGLDRGHLDDPGCDRLARHVDLDPPLGAERQVPHVELDRGRLSGAHAAPLADDAVGHGPHQLAQLYPFAGSPARLVQVAHQVCRHGLHLVGAWVEGLEAEAAVRCDVGRGAVLADLLLGDQQEIAGSLLRAAPQPPLDRAAASQLDDHLVP